MSFSKKESNRRILVVDDEADVLEFLRLFLEPLGWQVTAVPSADSAMVALDLHSYFLIITDVAMPAMDGYEFIAKAKERGIQSQFAVMTGFGYNPKHTLVQINKVQSLPLLFKPFNRKKIEETANTAFEEYHKGLQIQ
jgi:two-component system, sensor histidine kinase SagS